MRRLSIGLLASFAALGACAQSPATEMDPADVTLYREASYEFTWQRDSCFCTPESLQPIRIRVVDDRITSAVFVADGQPVPEAIRGGLMTIAGVFELIVQAQAADQEVEATFDTEQGYPTSVIFNRSQIPSDGGMELILSDVDLSEVK